MPFRLIRQVLDLRVAEGTVEAFHKGGAGGQPSAGPAQARAHHHARAHAERHRPQAQWTPARLLDKSTQIGPSAGLCEAVMAARANPS